MLSVLRRGSVVVDLLFIVLPIVLGVLCLSLFCYAFFCVRSSFAIILKKGGCFASIVLQMYCYYKCSVALPNGAMGWSAVCDCGNS